MDANFRLHRWSRDAQSLLRTWVLPELAQVIVNYCLDYWNQWQVKSGLFLVDWPPDLLHSYFGLSAVSVNQAGTCAFYSANECHIWSASGAPSCLRAIRGDGYFFRVTLGPDSMALAALTTAEQISLFERGLETWQKVSDFHFQAPVHDLMLTESRLILLQEDLNSSLWLAYHDLKNQSTLLKLALCPFSPKDFKEFKLLLSPLSELWLHGRGPKRGLVAVFGQEGDFLHCFDLAPSLECVGFLSAELLICREGGSFFVCWQTPTPLLWPLELTMLGKLGYQLKDAGAGGDSLALLDSSGQQPQVLQVAQLWRESRKGVEVRAAATLQPVPGLAQRCLRDLTR